MSAPRACLQLSHAGVGSGPRTALQAAAAGPERDREHCGGQGEAIVAGRGGRAGVDPAPLPLLPRHGSAPTRVMRDPWLSPTLLIW